MGGPVAEVKPRILLVDDDPDMRKLFGRYLENSGYEVVEAVDGDRKSVV